MEIKEILEEDEKRKICAEIISDLPEWFDANGQVDYPKGVKGTLFLAYFNDEKPIGFISIQENNSFTSEIYVIGVLKEYQGKKIGRTLLEAVYAKLIKQKKKLLAVKTLDASAGYAPYDRTRSFYSANGFMPIDCYPKIWNKENPCLIMVKVLS
jgi:GNAT superfamily N-acetyltransferase